MTDVRPHDPYAPLPRKNTKDEDSTVSEPASVTPGSIETEEPAKKIAAPRRVAAAKKAPSAAVAARKTAAARKSG